MSQGNWIPNMNMPFMGMGVVPQQSGANTNMMGQQQQQQQQPRIVPMQQSRMLINAMPASSTGMEGVINMTGQPLPSQVHGLAQWQQMPQMIPGSVSVNIMNSVSVSIIIGTRLFNI